MELPSWIKKIAGYAPEIGMAIATGGTSAIASTAMRVAAKVLTGDENATAVEIKQAAENATPDQLLALEKENNAFKIQVKTLELEEKKAENQDKQSEHQTTQETIRLGDNSDNKLVAITRPLQTWACLGISAGLAFMDKPAEYVFAFLAIVASYHGLRQIGKWKTSDSLTKIAK